MKVFLARLEQIAWFDRIGQPSERDGEVRRISRWEQWPGPEDLGVDAYLRQSQAWYDALTLSAGDRAVAVTDLWKRIHGVVTVQAASHVPYDPDADAWFGPTLCVRDAAWTAGLVGCTILLARSIPSELETIWWWYRARSVKSQAERVLGTSKRRAVVGRERRC